MNGFFICLLDLMHGSIEPVTHWGIFNNPNDAVDCLRAKRGTVYEESEGFFSDAGDENRRYIILPLTRYILDNWFALKEFTVIYRDMNGNITIGTVKSRIDLVEAEDENDLQEELLQQLEGIEIITIFYKENVRTKEIEFDATR